MAEDRGLRRDFTNTVIEFRFSQNTVDFWTNVRNCECWLSHNVFKVTLNFRPLRRVQPC